MLKFSPENAKITGLRAVDVLQKYLPDKRKIYSFDLLSGHSCPFANICLSKVIESDGKLKIVDGPNTTVRCFSASQEALYKNVYRLRKHNFNVLRKLDEDGMYALITSSLPKNAGIIRLHVGGDFFNESYLRAWIRVAESRQDILVYFYTKSLPYIVKHIDKINSIDNIEYTASKGGRRDDLIEKYNLRYSEIVFDEDTDLPIDHDDSHAATNGGNFALLVHGNQPKGSKAATAKSKLKGKGSYGRKKRKETVIS